VARFPRRRRRGLSQALHAAAIWANRNHDKTADLAARTLKLDPLVVRTMRRAVFAETVTPRMMQPVIDAGVTYGALGRPSPPKTPSAASPSGHSRI